MNRFNRSGSIPCSVMATRRSPPVSPGDDAQPREWPWTSAAVSPPQLERSRSTEQLLRQKTLRLSPSAGLRDQQSFESEPETTLYVPEAKASPEEVPVPAPSPIPKPLSVKLRPPKDGEALEVEPPASPTSATREVKDAPWWRCLTHETSYNKHACGYHTKPLFGDCACGVLQVLSPYQTSEQVCDVF